MALIAAGANPGAAIGGAGYTPLMLATANDARPLAQALIAKGAQVNAVNSGGVTALMIAVADGNADMVELLLRAGANAGVRDLARRHGAVDRAREAQQQDACSCWRRCRRIRAPDSTAPGG